ncbi:MAG: hypothetical protein ACRENP_27800, partial [Longimicrobiales bacterium]
MGEAPLTAALIAPAGFAHAGAARFLGASPAVPLAAVTAAANEDLSPAMGAYVQAARGQHRRSSIDAEDHRQTAPGMEYLARTRLSGPTSGFGVGRDIGWTREVYVAGAAPVSSAIRLSTTTVYTRRDAGRVSSRPSG